MTDGMQEGKGSPVLGPHRPRRHRTARICGVLSAALMLLLALAVVYSQIGIGCYLGVVLLIASLAILGGSALVLLLVVAWLRLSELIWLFAIGILTAFGTGLALQLLPAVSCGYPG